LENWKNEPIEKIFVLFVDRAVAKDTGLAEFQTKLPRPAEYTGSTKERDLKAKGRMGRERVELEGLLSTRNDHERSYWTFLFTISTS